MSMQRPANLSRLALVLVALLVAAACGTTQQAQQPTPSPSPSPPGGTVTVHGKVFVADELSFASCFGLPPLGPGGGQCVGFPVLDGTQVAAYDDAAIPPARSAAEGLRAALARLERLPKKSTKTVQALRKALSRAERAKPTKVPGNATPVATAVTSNGNYTLNVPASFVGKNLLVCVTGQPATPNPNPGNPNIIGFCTTMTVMPNTEGNTAVNQVNFVAPELGGDDNFIIDVRSAATGQSVIGGVIGQTEALDIVFARPVTPGLRAQLDQPTGTATTPDACFWFEADSPFDATYSGYGGTSTGLPRSTDSGGSALRVVTSLPQPNVYRFQGAVQWRSERTQDTPYIVHEECLADIFFMEPSAIITVQMSANLGQAVAPVLEEIDEIPLAVRQDTVLPRFATGGLGTPTTVPSGYGNYDISDDRVHIPFSEPIVDASAAGGQGVTLLLSLETTGNASNDSEWTMFVPASDTSNFTKPTGGTLATNFVFDAHVNNWVGSGGSFHLDDGGVADAVVAARLHAMRTDADETDPELVAGNSVLTRFSAGIGDAWATGSDPTFIADKGGWQVTAGGGNDAFLTFGGNVVP